MPIKWGFGKKEGRETPLPQEETPAPERDGGPQTESPIVEADPGGAPAADIEAGPKLDRKGILLLGRGYAASAWEKRFSALGTEYFSDQALKPAEIANLEFEVIIETNGLASKRGFWREDNADPGEFPALALGGVVLVPCYGSSATVAAAAIDQMETKAVGYTIFAPPNEEAAAAPTIEIARPMQAEEAPWKEAIRHLRLWGFKTEIAGDAPGLVFGRTIACLINEAAHALAEKIASPEDIDAAMQLGVNYPKGLFAWADELGLHLVLEILDGLADHYDEDRYRPAPLLRHMMLAKKKFFAAPPAQDSSAPTP